jgi:cell division septal protein FtsQ
MLPEVAQNELHHARNYATQIIKLAVFMFVFLMMLLLLLLLLMLLLLLL